MKSTKQFNAEAVLAAGALVAPGSCEQRDEKGTDPGGMAGIDLCAHSGADVG